MVKYTTYIIFGVLLIVFIAIAHTIKSNVEKEKNKGFMDKYKRKE